MIPRRRDQLVRKIPGKVRIPKFAERNPARRRALEIVTDAVEALEHYETDVKVPATADTEFAVRHPLNRRVRNIELVGQDAAGSVYRSRPDQWLDNLIFLRYNRAGGTIRLRLS